MLEVNDSRELTRRDLKRECWATMRSAYAEYLRLSEALESLTRISDGSPTSVRPEQTMLPTEQRVAFERYVEARMEFVESRFDEIRRHAGSRTTQPTATEERTRMGSFLAAFPFIGLALTLGMLSLTVFFLAGEHRRVRELENARVELGGLLGSTREGLDSLAKKLDAAQGSTPSQIQQVEPPAAPLKPVEKPRKPAPVAKAKWRRLPRPPTALRIQDRSPANRNHGPESRVYRQFTLSPSRKFKNIGPIEISLRSVDPQQKSVSLSILFESGNLHFDHLKPNEPVRINASRRRPSVELVIDRIAKDGLYGHLIETGG